MFQIILQNNTELLLKFPKLFPHNSHKPNAYSLYVAMYI